MFELVGTTHLPCRICRLKSAASYPHWLDRNRRRINGRTFELGDAQVHLDAALPDRHTLRLHEPKGMRVVLDGLRGEHSIAELCRREGIAEGLYYSWSKEFLEAGKRRLAGDTARAATSDEVKDLKRQAQELKEVVAEQALELRLLKKSMIADGGDEA